MATANSGTRCCTKAVREPLDGRKSDKIWEKESSGINSRQRLVTRLVVVAWWPNRAHEFIPAKVQSAIDTGIPTTISYGFVSGFCSGYALKKVGKVVAVVLGMFVDLPPKLILIMVRFPVGLGFLGVQTLANFGYINVDHSQISDDFSKALDLNQDGKVDQEDANIAYEKTLNALQLNLPAGGGFAAGFIGGLRSG